MAWHRHGRVPAQQGKPLGQRPCPPPSLTQALLQPQKRLEGWGTPSRPRSPFVPILHTQFCTWVFVSKTLEPPPLGGAGWGWCQMGGSQAAPSNAAVRDPAPSRNSPHKIPPPTLFLFSFLNGKAANHAGCTPCLRGSSQHDGNHSARMSREEKSTTITPPPTVSCDATSTGIVQHPRVPVPASWQQEQRRLLVPCGSPGMRRQPPMVSLSPALEAAAAEQPSKGLNPTATPRSRRDVAATGFYLAQAA